MTDLVLYAVLIIGFFLVGKGAGVDEASNEIAEMCVKEQTFTVNKITYSCKQESILVNGKSVSLESK